MEEAEAEGSLKLGSTRDGGRARQWPAGRVSVSDDIRESLQ